MPQLQLPIFPAGVTEINTRVAVEAKDGRVCYIHGHLPVFQHEEKDVWSFRMFTSQMIVNGTAKPKEIVARPGSPCVVCWPIPSVHLPLPARSVLPSTASAPVPALLPSAPTLNSGVACSHR